MAVSILFRRIDTYKGLFAIEKISLLYNLLTALLVACFWHRLDHPGQMLWERVQIAAMTFLLMYLYRLAPCRLAAYVRVVMQMMLLSYWYPDTFEFNRILPNQDHLFAAAEQWLFGGQPSVWFSARFPGLWASEPFHLGYFFYYPMMFVVVTWYFLCRFELLEKVSFVLIASFFLYYLIYMFLPVAGPQYYFPAIGMDNVQQGLFPAIGDYFDHHHLLPPKSAYEHGFFYSLVEGMQQVGERPTAAFPSSHVGISTILMIMSWRGNRWLFLCLMPFYLLLCGATVYIQAHYVIDALAGFLSAFLFYWASTHLYKRWFARPVSLPLSDVQRAE